MNPKTSIQEPDMKKSGSPALSPKTSFFCGNGLGKDSRRISFWQQGYLVTRGLPNLHSLLEETVIFLHNVPRRGIGEYRKGLEAPKYTPTSLMIKLASFIIVSRMSSILSELNIVLYLSGLP